MSVAGEFLNSPHGGSPYCQMRNKRVPKHMDAPMHQVSLPRGLLNAFLDEPSWHRRPFSSAQHPRRIP